MNPRAKFGGGKVSKIKKYSGTEGSDVEADDVEAKRTARAKRIREYNATPRAQEAKRTAEEMVRKLNIPGPDEPKSSSAVDAIKAGASRAAGPGKGTEQGALTAEQRKRLDRPTTPTSLPPSKDKPKESLADKNSKTLSQMLKKHVKEHPESYPTEAEAEILKEQEDKKMDKQTNEGYENYKKRRQSGEMSGYKKGGSVKKNWIKDAIKKPGALRQSLGVKKGEKIPTKKLATAAKKPGKMGQRARLAQTLKGFSRGGGVESRGKTRGKFV